MRIIFRKYLYVKNIYGILVILTCSYFCIRYRPLFYYLSRVPVKIVNTYLTKNSCNALKYGRLLLYMWKEKYHMQILGQGQIRYAHIDKCRLYMSRPVHTTYVWTDEKIMSSYIKSGYTCVPDQYDVICTYA